MDLVDSARLRQRHRHRHATLRASYLVKPTAPRMHMHPFQPRHDHALLDGRYQRLRGGRSGWARRRADRTTSHEAMTDRTRTHAGAAGDHSGTTQRRSRVHMQPHQLSLLMVRVQSHRWLIRHS
ncbi:hypothetical protein BDA96_02G247300 [Sorghum bicolor]|uniref:Uncharacterized protein n=2 Tax=Sorghum bicolor TaxID=4558 RepID=A0A921UTN4_SORBI|nr:hypothetical protein BDA96_02G247300 [Sorghum bicolor]KXG35842.1 hypothetical protein SORBI_3002G236300 [Sorghum bicolor]